MVDWLGFRLMGFVFFGLRILISELIIIILFFHVF